MAKRKSKQSDVVDRAAEAIGHALGSVVGTVESLQAQHPHPVEEAREVLAAGRESLGAVTSEARTRATGIIEKAKAIARRPKKVATGARRKTRVAVARVTRAARKMVKRARKAVKPGRKTVKRSAARRKR